MKRIDAQSLVFPNFRKFLTAKFLVTMAIQMQFVVVGWKVYHLTKDPLTLGFLGLFEAIPAIIVTFFSGWVADSFNRKMICLYAYLGLIFSSGLLVINNLYLNELLYIYYLSVILNGISRGFLSPANFAMMSEIVPRELYQNSSAWNGNIWQLAAITGPALGGIIYAWKGDLYAFGFIMFALFVAFINYSLISYTKHTSSIHFESIKEKVLGGMRFVVNNKLILSALGLDLLAVLFGGVTALLPVFASDVLFTDAKGLGLLRAAPAIGAALMGFFLVFKPINRYAGVLLLFAVAGFGISSMLFALSKSFQLSMVLLAVSGALDTISVVLRSTLLQLLTPDHMRGRVAAVNAMFIGSSNEIGAFESGVAAKILGLIPSVIFGTSVTCGVTLGIGIFSKKLRKLHLSDLTQNGKSSSTVGGPANGSTSTD